MRFRNPGRNTLRTVVESTTVSHRTVIVHNGFRGDGRTSRPVRVVLSAKTTVNRWVAPPVVLRRAIVGGEARALLSLRKTS